MTWFLATVRRSLWLVLLVAAGGAAYAWWRDRRDDDHQAPAEWPPLVPSATETTAGGWTDPLEDGSCPISHPVKANDNSGIFHVPGGRFYDRTKPERCYADADAAVVDGYRQAKN